MAATDKRFLLFQSEGLGEDVFQVSSFRGQEALSRPYMYEIELASTDASVDLEAVVKQAAWLGIKQGLHLADGSRALHTRKIHGVVYDFEQLEMRDDLARYRARLVPKLWQLSLSRRSRIFLEGSVPEIVEQILQDYGFASAEFEFRSLAGNYPVREYVVQYGESDLDFVHRWLERCGIWYFFEQTDDGEKVVFADDPSAYAVMSENPTLPYRPQDQERGNRSEAGDTEGANQDWFREEVVTAIGTRLRAVPGEVVLNDYNWRTPSQNLKVEEKVVDGGVGTIYEYNNHYQSAEDEGAALGKVRGDEIRCRRQVFSGTSDCRALRPGATFTLSEHYRGAWDQSYLATDVEHHGTQQVGLAASAEVGATYDNEFTAIPASATFRPERVALWPKITGVMHAKVDGPAGAVVAQIDDQGRYKVKLPLDLSDASEGKASRYVRMAQPFAGADYGMHLPLHVGTEVLLAHIDGDPDRPIIVGSVPNPETASPVTSDNAERNVIKTASGCFIEIKD